MAFGILLLVLIVLILVLSFCFHLAGGIIKLLLRLVICLPCALICGALGLVFCCTILLIPLGIACFYLARFLCNPFPMSAC